MVTWWKRIKYSSITKALACLLLSIAVLMTVQGSIILDQAQYQNAYYDNWNIRNELISTAGYVRDWIVRYTNTDIFDEKKITEEEVNKYIQNSEALRISLEQVLENSPEKVAIEERAKKGILADRKQYKAKIEQELNMPNLMYFATDRNTHQVITNIEAYDGKNLEDIIKMFTSKPFYIKGNGATLAIYEDGYEEESGEFENYYSGKPFVEQNDYEIYVALADTLVPGDIFYTQQERDIKLEQAEKIALPEMVLGVILIIIVSIYGLQVIGKTPEDLERITMRQIDKIPLEIQGVLACIFALVWINLVNKVGHITEICTGIYFDLEAYGALFIIVYAILCLALMIILVPVISFIRHLKNHSMSQSLLCIRGIQKMTGAIKEDHIIGLVIGVGALYVLLIGFFMLMMLFNTNVVIGLILWGISILMLVVAVVSVAKFTIDYVKIVKATQKIGQGNFETKVELMHALPIMTCMASQLNNIGAGLEEAIEKSLKSERLKTELITNVSHDLKTPLTSIISYIELLKDEEIDNKVAQEYIDVLAERSNRLKQLVEDLVEASKAATGNIKADLQVLSLDELVLQAVGEYSDRLGEQHLEIVTSPLEKVNILADGKHMWRILENLLSNVIKYAMAYTRVYIEVRAEEEYGKFIIKNISRESLNLLEVSELTERFVRGEASRTTEGSGLGLAITQGLIVLQYGKLDIHLDGDLFKVEVSIPREKG